MTSMHFSEGEPISVKQLQIPYSPTTNFSSKTQFLSGVMLRPEKTKYIMFCCGNAGNKGYHVGFVKPLLTIFPEHAIVMFDYEGYGDSAREGSAASLKGLHESTLAVYRFLKQTTGSDKIVVIAQSIGVGSACSILPFMNPNDRIIAINGFSSLRAMMNYWIPAPLKWIYGPFLNNDFNNVKQIKEKNSAQVPIMAMHATQDEIIPFTIGQQLGAETRYFVPIEGTHNAPVFDKHFRAMQEFVSDFT